MNSIDENCLYSQIIYLCNLHNIVHYILAFRFKLFKSNSHIKYKTTCHVWSSCANRYMYSIGDHDARESIFKAFLFIGSKMEKFKAIQVKDRCAMNDSQQARLTQRQFTCTNSIQHSTTVYSNICKQCQEIDGSSLLSLDFVTQ